MALIETNFIRPQEVYDRNTGQSIIQYRSYDGTMRQLPSMLSGLRNILSLSDIAKKIVTGDVVVTPLQLTTNSGFTICSHNYVEPTEETITEENKDAVLDVDDNSFSVGDTILVDGVLGYEDDGETEAESFLQLYVLEVNESAKTIKARAVNGKTIGEIEGCVPSIGRGKVLTRMGNASKDYSTATDYTLNVSEGENYCQEFNAEAEIPNVPFKAAKETIENDFNNTLDISFLFGNKGKVEVEGKEILTTGGIFNQPLVNEFYYAPSALVVAEIFEQLKTNDDRFWVALCGNALMREFADVSEKSVIISSVWGDLLCVYCPPFDDAGYITKGLIFNPKDLCKYVFKEKESKKAGDKLLLTETSCMWLQNPNKAIRLIPEE